MSKSTESVTRAVTACARERFGDCSRVTGRVENPARPPRASCWVELNSQRFDAVAEASELPDHSRSACSLQPFADRLAAFLVADPSMQDYPDQPSKPMGNCPNGLIVSQAWYEAAIQDLEDASFRPDRNVGALIEKGKKL